MSRIGLTMVGNTAVFNCGGIELDPTKIETRARQVLPLLEVLLTADGLIETLAENEVNARIRGIIAQSMICDASLTAAIGHAELLHQIVTGAEAIENHGFPEYRDGMDIDV